MRRSKDLVSLGPDLLADEFDQDEAFQRVRARPSEPIADVLLNQRVLAGIGNVYKSEVLFACGVDPFARVQQLSDEHIHTLLSTARKFLRANVTEGLAAMTTYLGFRRTTRQDDPSARLWVYGRVNEPCRRCGTPVLIDKRGTNARLTYWCPSCQVTGRP